MIRVPQYNAPPRRIRTGGIDPGAPRVLIDNAARSAHSDVVDALLGAGRDVTQASLSEYISEQSAAVSEALQEYREALSRERDRYMRTNTGKDAIDAGRHFDEFSFETAQPLADRFSGRFREAFLKDAAATGLHFTEEGQAYARQQKAAWDKRVFEGDKAQVLAGIAADPGNRDFIAFTLDNLRERHAALFPDADRAAAFAELDRAGAGAIIEGFLARNRLEDARGAFAQYRDFLGERAPGYEVKINSKARELEAKARQEQAETRVAVAERLECAEAAWKEGLDTPDAPSRMEIENICGSEASTIWERMENLRIYSGQIRALRAMTPEQQDIFLQQQAAELGDAQGLKSRALESLAKAVAEDRRMREKDSAEYLVRVEPAVAEARAAMQRQMTPQTVARYASVLRAAGETRGMDGNTFLPKDDAAKLAESIEEDPYPVAALTRLRKIMGTHWAALNKQWTKNGNLSATMRIVAAGMSERSGKLLIEAVMDKDFIHKAEVVLALNGRRKTEFEDAIYEIMMPFNRTFLAGGDSSVPYTLNHSVNILALQYMMRGYEADEAVEKAANEIVLSRYALVGSRTHTFRVPAAFDTGAVESGATAELRRVVAEPSNLLLPPSGGMDHRTAARRYAEWIEREGYWVTDSEESGLILFIADRAVRGADGDVIRRTWDELADAGAKERARLDLWQLEVPGAGL